jgi:hypothetical protein
MEVADNKMQKRIEQYNQMAMKVDSSQFPVGLYEGKMGLCIYFYEVAGLTSERKYRMIANKLFDDVVNRVTDKIEIDPSSGLTGICMAVNYLIESGHIKGSPNQILKNYDDKIIQSLLFNRLLDFNPDLDRVRMVSGCLMYLITRLKNDGLSANEREIMQGVVIEMINKIESLHFDKLIEPVDFSITDYFAPLYLKLLQRMYQLGFYNYKIERIIDGLTPHILCRYPLNKTNRFSLCMAMKDLNAIAGGIAGWDKHIELLQRDLVIHQVINEFRNKNITFNKGLCGFYYLLRKTGVDRTYDELFVHKITTSDFWDNSFEKGNPYAQPFSLYNGAPGVILTYLHIMNQSCPVMFFDKAMGQYA